MIVQACLLALQPQESPSYMIVQACLLALQSQESPSYMIVHSQDCGNFTF